MNTHSVIMVILLFIENSIAGNMATLLSLQAASGTCFHTEQSLTASRTDLSSAGLICVPVLTSAKSHDHIIYTPSFHQNDVDLCTCSDLSNNMHLAIGFSVQ